MTKSEDATSGTTVVQTKNITESEKDQTRNSSVQGGRGYRGNTKNNTRYSVARTNKYYNSEIEAFGDVFTLKYGKLELKESFDVLRWGLINYTIKYLKKAKDVIVLLQYMEYSRASFDTKN